PFAVMYKQIHSEIPSPRSVNPELSPVWDEVILRGLAKEPDERYLTARALDEAVQRAWRQVQRDSGEWRVREAQAPGALAERADRAREEGDWQRVIALCGQILASAPAHAEAARLLAQAQAAMRGDSGGLPTLAPAPSPPPPPPYLSRPPETRERSG